MIVIVPDALLKLSVAVIVTTVANAGVNVLTLNVVLVWPAGTTTLAGILTSDGWLLDNWYRESPRLRITRLGE